MNYPLHFDQKLPNRELHAGQFIFEEGDSGDVAYIIEEGLVEIFTLIDNQHTVLNTLKQGEMFGELALVDGSPRSASACAKTDVLLTIVTKEQVQSRIQAADPILRLFFMMVMRYFRSETSRSRLNDLKNDLFVLDRTTQVPQTKQAIDLIRLESDLRGGFNQGELKPFFQPIVDVQSNTIAGFELLLRWYSNSRGNYISPAEFIPLAESTSLIISIGDWIFDEAIAFIEQAKRETGQDVFISINVAEKQIFNKDFFEIITQKVVNSQVQPQQIKLEILERDLFEKEAYDSLIVLMESCREFGFPLVIDDFGTRFANLNYLTQFNFDTLKIDKCFIDNLVTSKKHLAICRALIDLSHGLGMTTVAEGVETQAQLKTLFDLDCNFGQGYLFSKPIEKQEAIVLIKEKCQQN